MSDTVLDFQINALRRAMEDLQYEKRQLQQRMNTNRQKMAEFRAALKKLEERRKTYERNSTDHADVQPGAAMG